MRMLQKFTSVHASVHNHFPTERHFQDRNTYKQTRAVALAEWRRHYNTVKPHSSLEYRPPAPEVFIPMDRRPIMH